LPAQAEDSGTGKPATLHVLAVGAVLGALLFFGRLAAEYHSGVSVDGVRNATVLALLATKVLSVALLSLVAGVVIMLVVRKWIATPLRDATAVVTFTVAAIAIASGCLWIQRSARKAHTMRVLQVTDLASDLDAWTVLSSREGSPPRSDVITTSRNVKFDGGDLQAIVMPPPCELMYVVTEPGPARLNAAAGAHFDVNRYLSQKMPAVDFRFRIWINDEIVLDESVHCEKTAPAKERAWRRLRSGRGIEVSPGDRIRLRTDVDGEFRPGSWNWPVGFGGIELSRSKSAPRALSSPRSPNIVLVVMDTLRADRCSTFGYGPETTPQLTRLAEHGTLFEEAQSSSSWTWPSTASLLTGLGVDEHGVRDAEACYLNGSVETLSEVLQARGYTTAGYSGNPLIVAERNYDQGFEFFRGSRSGFTPSSSIVPEAMSWMRERRGERFFLYLHLIDPHDPHHPMPEFEEQFAFAQPEDFEDHGMTRYAKALNEDSLGSEQVPATHARWIDNIYDASVATGDHWLGVVLDTLDDLNLSDETIVVFTSDHGEELFDHGSLKHSHSLHRELVHVPLVMAGPGIAAGRRVQEPISNRNVAPTLARLGGASLPGIALPMDLLDPTGEESRPVVFATHIGWLDGKPGHQILGGRKDDWVVHFTPAGGTEESLRIHGLYDLSVDPYEANDLSKSNPARTQQMIEATVESFIEQRREAPRAMKGGVQTLELLRGIGYLGDEDED
jgi:arylsulfatase A-like enzyme